MHTSKSVCFFFFKKKHFDSSYTKSHGEPGGKTTLFSCINPSEKPKQVFLTPGIKKAFALFPYIFCTHCIARKAVTLFQVEHNYTFARDFGEERPGCEVGYLRYLLHVRQRSSSLPLHHRECPRFGFYFGTFRSYMRSLSVTVPFKF